MKIFITPTGKKRKKPQFFSLKIFLLKETSGFMPRSQAFEKSLNISTLALVIGHLVSRRSAGVQRPP